jgi:hypothetical protein
LGERANGRNGEEVIGRVAPNLVGRGSGKTARSTSGIDGHQLTRSVTSKNAPSRDLALDHGSDFASRCLVLDYGAEGSARVQV